MSAEKREQLIAEGKLREDGSRIERCPTCTQELPKGFPVAGSAVGEAEIAEAGVETPAPGGDE
jgi:hypothetical protein